MPWKKIFSVVDFGGGVGEGACQSHSPFILITLKPSHFSDNLKFEVDKNAIGLYS